MWPIFGPISGQYLANTTYNGRILIDHFLTIIWPILTQYNMYWPNTGRDLFGPNSGENSGVAAAREWRVSERPIPSYLKCANILGYVVALEEASHTRFSGGQLIAAVIVANIGTDIRIDWPRNNGIDTDSSSNSNSRPPMASRSSQLS
ncbi:hypothetical protein DFH08DRAFT_799395 [Mycena albidolilacea]|uniref:Uncharacterized protein n=1 Tax=Mycena albidolilacea TaxID=1033008 RepID=A0AAD7AM17_9AGAR|nr:hypothetical protein DFH08DRAFT_799395 [Mycena albidolilacea]